MPPASSSWCPGVVVNRYGEHPGLITCSCEKDDSCKILWGSMGCAAEPRCVEAGVFKEGPDGTLVKATMPPASSSWCPGVVVNRYGEHPGLITCSCEKDDSCKILWGSMGCAAEPRCV